MKKKLLFLAIFTLIWSVSSANCSECNKKMLPDNSYECQEKSKKENNCENKADEKNSETTCDKYEIENDDEYCTYNQCYFDKHYRKMKKTLCLTRRQESCIDKLYRDFKTDMEASCCKYRNEKSKLLEMIECDKDCQKEQIKALKELKKENKEKLKDFRDEVKEQLCKNQRSDYKKFIRDEKKKMKKIVKYSIVYKLPCVNCRNK